MPCFLIPGSNPLYVEKDKAEPIDTPPFFLSLLRALFTIHPLENLTTGRFGGVFQYFFRSIPFIWKSVENISRVLFGARALYAQKVGQKYTDHLLFERRVFGLVQDTKRGMN